MIAFNSPNIVRNICEDYAYLFAHSKLTFGPLSSLIAFSLFGISTISDGVRTFPRAPSVSSICDAIKDFEACRFMNKVRKILKSALRRQAEPDRFIYVVDDTAIPKAGKNMFAVGNWHTSSKNAYHGQKLLVLSVVDTKHGIAYPAAFRFCLKEGLPGYKPNHQLALELLDEALASDLPKLPLVADSGFDCVSLIQGCYERNIPIYVEVKSNRKVRHAVSRKIPKKRLRTYFQSGVRTPVKLNLAGKVKKTKYIAIKFAFINGFMRPVKMAAVFNKRMGYHIYGYFLTTDRDATCEKIWFMSRARWFIECLFRDLKQNFALGKLQGRSRADAEISICIPFAIIIHIRLHQTAEETSKSPSRLETVGTFVARIKEQNFEKTVTALASDLNQSLKVRLQARRCSSRIHQKPVNMLAKSRRVQEVHAA